MLLPGRTSSHSFIPDELGVSKYYKEHSIQFASTEIDRQSGHPVSLEEMVERIAKAPLCFQPGAEWRYSHATDVLGYLVEVISGTTFESFLRDRVFNPLGMHETAFAVAEDDMHRFAALYMWGKGGELRLDQGFRTTFGYRRLENEKDFISPIGTPSGGGGLVSTLGDYMSFCKMLLNGGRGVGGKRAQILSPMTVDFMRKNHLDGDMTDMGEHASNFLGMNRKGVGFGLGFSVVVDSVAQPVVSLDGLQSEFTPGKASATLATGSTAAPASDAGWQLLLIVVLVPPHRPSPGALRRRVCLGWCRIHLFLARFQAGSGLRFHDTAHAVQLIRPSEAASGPGQLCNCLPATVTEINKPAVPCRLSLEPPWSELAMGRRVGRFNSMRFHCHRRILW